MAEPPRGRLARSMKSMGPVFAQREKPGVEWRLEKTGVCVIVTERDCSASVCVNETPGASAEAEEGCP